MENATISYFGKATVEDAVRDFFEREGVTKVKRDELITLAVYCEEKFFEMVSEYIMNHGPVAQ